MILTTDAWRSTTVTARQALDLWRYLLLTSDTWILTTQIWSDHNIFLSTDFDWLWSSCEILFFPTTENRASEFWQLTSDHCNCCKPIGSTTKPEFSWHLPLIWNDSLTQVLSSKFSVFKNETKNNSAHLRYNKFERVDSQCEKASGQV